MYENLTLSACNGMRTPHCRSFTLNNYTWELGKYTTTIPIIATVTITHRH